MEGIAKVELSKKAEIEGISADVTDNGKFIVNWTIYTPAKTNSGSEYDNHKEAYNDIEDALSKIGALFRAKLEGRTK